MLRDATVNASDELHDAAFQGEAACLANLLRDGADVDQPSSSLMAAAVVFPAPVTDAAAAAAMRGGGAALALRRWRLRVRHLAKGAVGSSGLGRSLTSAE